MLNTECEAVLSHLMFHKSLIDDGNDEAKQQRLEEYVKMVEQMQQGVYLSSNDPFERSVAAAFELIIRNSLNPWEIDLIEFSKTYLQKVRKTNEINLIIAGKLVYMAWEIFRLQTEELLGRVDRPETVENAFESWDTDAIELYSTIDEPGASISIMRGELELDPAMRRASAERHVSLLELLDAFDEAKHEAEVREEIAKYMDKYKPKDFDNKAHDETIEQDIAETWKRIESLGAGAIAVSDLFRGDKDDKVAVFMSVLFLTIMEKITIWQDKPPFGEIFVEIAHPKNIVSIRDSSSEVIDLSEVTKVGGSDSAVVK